MTQQTRELGKRWINCCISPETYHDLDKGRFREFIYDLLEEKSNFVPSDIEVLIQECNKKWCEQSVEMFTERWYKYYEDLKDAYLQN